MIPQSDGDEKSISVSIWGVIGSVEKRGDIAVGQKSLSRNSNESNLGKLTSLATYDHDKESMRTCPEVDFVQSKFYLFLTQ